MYGKSGNVTAVPYEQINNILLKEFLKEHKKVSRAGSHRPAATERNGGSHSAAQRQTAQIQKVSAQLELSKPAAKVVVNEP